MSEIARKAKSSTEERKEIETQQAVEDDLKIRKRADYLCRRVVTRDLEWKRETEIHEMKLSIRVDEEGSEGTFGAVPSQCEDQESKSQASSLSRMSFHQNFQQSSGFYQRAESVTSSIKIRGEVSTDMIEKFAKFLGETNESFARRLRSTIENDFRNGHCFGNDYSQKDMTGKSCLLVLMTSYEVFVIHDVTTASAFDASIAKLGVPCVLLDGCGFMSLWLSTPRKSGKLGVIAGREIRLSDHRAFNTRKRCATWLVIVGVKNSFVSPVQNSIRAAIGTAEYVGDPLDIDRRYEFQVERLTRIDKKVIIMSALESLQNHIETAGGGNVTLVAMKNYSTSSQLIARFQGSLFESVFRKATMFDVAALAVNAIAIVDRAYFRDQADDRKPLCLLFNKRTCQVMQAMIWNSPLTLVSRYDVFEGFHKHGMIRKKSPSLAWISYTADWMTSFTAPWGRSHRPQAESGMGKLCATLQFHARVCKSQLSDLLRKSGYNKVYVTPKSWIGELLPGYSVVWVQASREEITALAMTVQGQCGLVRSKARVGVRVPEQSFQAVFEQLRPGAQAPARVAIKDTYRLSGLPPGLRSEDLIAWGSAVKWPLRPLRPLGPRQWIVGAASTAPDGHLSFNDQPILVQRVPPRTTAQPIVCAGRVPPQAQAGMRDEEDPWQHNDPWKQYLHKTRPIETATPTAPRQIAAPTEERFQEQDKRFQNIEAALKEVQQAQTAISSDSQQLRQDVQVEIASVRTDVSSVKGEIERQMKTNMDAVQQAIQVQQHQMSAGFDEIKALLQAGQKHSRRGPPAKRDSAQSAEEPGGMNDL